MKTLIGLTKDEMSNELKTFEKYRVKQLWNWIYYYGITDFNKMNNLSKDMRSFLKKNYTLERPKILKHLVSKDGTQKWLLEFEECDKSVNMKDICDDKITHELQQKDTIEMVYIPADDRGTLCISSQIGCSMGCKFCNTGKQGFTRNLTAGEIVSQLLITRDQLGEWDNLNKAIGEGRMISNIVLMGMGEPLLNRENVENAIHIINDPDGIAFSNRRITLSTCGIVPEIKKLDLKVNLALSLHASNDIVRKQIMPIAEKYNIDETLKVCGEYAKKNSDRRITFEYILIEGVNDAEKHAHELIKLVKKHNLPAKFNLIPFNEWNGCEFKTSKNAIKFAKILTDANYPAPIRRSMGQDIMAACGQLKETTKVIK
ncbi:MAG: 23S rRNA (adenine(2503)-C(2))-methyltransferase RlmN [Rickettsiales bacterium]|jgi:23S rRNA (adenine2503-C2)-methyltransferase|nr:23S rRNA (adenine(2503)-C(2))-methyltransferase RlmN [Rickettsiales bacterium]